MVLVDLLAFSVSHDTASLALRDRLALAPSEAASALLTLRSAGAEEAVVLSTCHRTELYMAAEDLTGVRGAALEILGRGGAVSAAELDRHVQVLRDQHVAMHLFTVTAGLQSMVLGEAEIQGQVRRAHDSARAQGTCGRVLDRMFVDALAAGSRVRERTAIARGGASVSSVAVELAAEAGGRLEGRRVLVVGAGESGTLSARALAREGTEVVVASRCPSRAQSLADGLGTAVPMADVPAQLEHADVVFTATSSPGHVLDRATIAAAMAARPADRPLVIVDLAVPRDVAPAAGELRGVTLIDVDDVGRRLERNRARRQAEVDAATALVAIEAQRFERWLAGRHAAPAVGALYELADSLVAEVLGENDAAWEGLTAADRGRVEALARSVARRLLHEPARRLREAPGMSTDLALDMFGLGDRSHAAVPRAPAALPA